jgi:hypothetical protein
MRKASLVYLAVSVLICVFWCSQCAPRIQLVEGGRYVDPQGYFELTLPQGSWELLSWEDVDFALWDPHEGATIVVNVTPLKKDVNLDTLTRHLLIAFERKQIISQTTVTIDGREAAQTVLQGWVEDTEIKAETYVVRGEKMVYDIIFWAPRDAFPRTVEQFHQFLLTITFLQP